MWEHGPKLQEIPHMLKTVLQLKIKRYLTGFFLRVQVSGIKIAGCRKMAYETKPRQNKDCRIKQAVAH
jgi:hypothetical protein